MSTVEFSAELLDKVAEALHAHDIMGQGPAWETALDVTKKMYRGFAQAALEAAYHHARHQETFMTRMVMASGVIKKGYPRETLTEAERVMRSWREQEGDENIASLAIEHCATLLLNRIEYWTQSEIEGIRGEAAEQAEWFRKNIID